MKKRFLAAVAMALLLSLIITPMAVSATGPVINADASSWDRSEGYPSNALNHEEDAIWHSLWNVDAARDHHEYPIEDIEENDEGAFPKVWIAEFDDVYRLDTIGYLRRPLGDSTNGIVLSGEFWVSTTGSITDFDSRDGWTQVGTLERTEEEWEDFGDFVNIYFDEVEARLVKMVVLDGIGGWASAAHIAFGFTDVAYIPFSGFDATFVPATQPIWMAPEMIIRGSRSIIVATDFDPYDYGKEGTDGYQHIRPGHNVRTEVGGSQFGGNIGWIGAGDWVQYTVQVPVEGSFLFSAWQASGSDEAGGVRIYIGGESIGESDATTQSDWQDYNLYEVGVANLAAGEHVIRVYFPDGGLNFAALEVTPYVEATPAPEPSDEPADEASDDEAADDETDVNDEAADVSADTDDDDGNMILIIIIAVAAAVVIACVIIIIVKKKKS